MLAPQTPGPVAQIAIGAAISLVVFGALSVFLNGCVNSSTVECKLSALNALPADPLMVTPHDAVDLINRVHACDRGAVADAGAR